jgi:NAD(P)-dependent dehydrogenase (short-subunit alcohol dehydrogenase family)
MGRRFLELGAELIICGRRLELLEATAAAMRLDSGGKVTAIRCDIRDGAAVEAMMDEIWREAPLDVLVNNAAATFIAQTEHLSFRAADAILAPTLHGTMYCTLATGRRWIDAGHKGAVLSILSTSIITGRAFTVPSARSNGGRKVFAPWRSRPARFRLPARRASYAPRAANRAGVRETRSAVPASIASWPILRVF